MDAVNIVRSPNASLPGRKLEAVELLHNDIGRLLRHGGEAEDYVALYYQIPAFMKSWRNKFYRRIFKQASHQRWSREKVAIVLSGIR